MGNKLLTIYTVIALPLILASCAAPNQTKVVSIQAPFDEVQAQDSLKPGNGRIEGSAFMRQQGGGVVTCAGSRVHLIPDRQYARERLAHIYGSAHLYGSSEVTQFQNKGVFGFQPDPPSYKTLQRTTTCDAQGNFVFDKVRS